MASVDVGIHPDPAGTGITAKHYPGGPPASFSTLNLDAGESHVSIFVSKRPVLDALQAALDAIRADMDASEAPAIVGSVPDTMNCAECGSWGHRTAEHAVPEAVAS